MVASIAAAMDLEMPGNPFTPPVVVEAVRNGQLHDADLDRAVAKVLQLVDRQAAMESDDPFSAAIVANLPFKKLSGFSGGTVTEAQLGLLLMLINSNMPPGQVTAILDQATQPPGE